MKGLLAFLARLFEKPQDERRLTPEEVRADYWTRVTWPATWSRINDLSRY